MFRTISSPHSPKVLSAARECARRSPSKAVWLVLFCAVLSSPGTLPVIGQAVPGATTTAAPSHHAVTAPPPQRIIEREGNGCTASGTDYSIVWTFDGLKGMGKFDITEQAMDIDSFDGHTLVVRRTSYAGGRIGAGQVDGTAVYTGQITGTHIIGTATYHPTGKSVSEGPWCGEIEDPRVLMPETLAAKQSPIGVPPQILECELNQRCDGLWSFGGSSGKAVWPRNPDVLADLTVESFSPDKIVIRRNDTAPNPLSAVYTGRLDGNRISGTVVAHAGDKSATYNWTAIVPATSCVRTDGLKPDTQEAMDVGSIALRFNLLPAALDCYLIAARNGDARAQNAVAVLYYQGTSPIKRDYAQAFYWVGKSAAQGNYFAEQGLANMYKEGKGTEADPVKAQYWYEQAAATPEAQAIALDKARAAQAKAMFGLFFGLLSGALDGDSGSSGIHTSPSDCSAYEGYMAQGLPHDFANYRSVGSLCGH